MPDDQIHVDVQLLDASGSNELWSEAYERDFSDIFAIQTDIAENIATVVGANLSEAETARIKQPLANSIEAYKVYLKARTLVSHLEGGMPFEFYQYMDEAIAIDPDFALAHAVKAAGYGLAHTFGNRSGMASLADVERIAAAHTGKALGIGPKSLFCPLGTGNDPLQPRTYRGSKASL